jgi:hypothetical protein
MQEQPENTLIQLMAASREEMLARLPWWRRWWWRLRGQPFEEWRREFDAAVRSAPTRKRR